MFNKALMMIGAFLASGILCSCASSRGQGDRRPSSYSRAGRAYKEPRAMNSRRMDTDSIFQACIRERTELYCRNRMGR